MASSPRGKLKLPLILRSIKKQRMILAVGSEAEGLSERLLEAAAERIRIEHRPDVESLNSAIAGSILMKECYDLRVRRNA